MLFIIDSCFVIIKGEYFIIALLLLFYLVVIKAVNVN